MTRPCAKCGAEFTYHCKTDRSYCPTCNGAYQRDWRKRHQESYKRSKKKWETANPEKHRAYKRAEHHRNKDRVQEYLLRRRAENPEVFVEYARREHSRRRELGLEAYYKYGVTLEQRRSIEADQGRLCLLCDEPLASVRKVCIDHEHETGLVRGVLCAKCNSWLGWCELRLARLNDYLIGPHYRPARWDSPRRRRDTGLPRGAWHPVGADQVRRRREKSRLAGHGSYSKYGVTPEQRQSIEAYQGGLCLLCDRPLTEVTAVIDHEHSTGLIRGVLCSHPCNVRLGWYEARAGRISDYLAGPHYRPARWDEQPVTA